MLLGNSSIKKPRKKVAALLSNNFGGNSAQSLLSSSPFYAQLTKSLVLNRGTGSPTYTGATAKTVKDHEGILRTGPSGCARFEGARYVRNLLTFTEDFSNAAWTKTNVTAAADGFLETAVTSTHRVQQAIVKAAAALPYIGSVSVKPNGRNWCAIGLLNTAETAYYIVYVNLLTGATGTAVSAGFTSNSVTVVAESNGYYRISLKSTTDTAANLNLYVYAATADNTASYAGDITKGLYVKQAQIEDITGRADQTTPSEYVSVGALDYRSTQDPLYLSLPGTAGHYASTPDSVPGSVTGDIDIRCKVAMTDWTDATEPYIASKYAGAGSRSWFIYARAAGSISFRVSLDGTTTVLATSSAATGFTDGSTNWIRVTRASSSGNVNFYTSSDGITWTLLGAADQATTAGAIFDSAAPIELGAGAGGTGPLNGKIFSAQIYNTIDGTTPVVDFNPHRDATTPTGTITSSTTGEVWTINGASSVVRNAAYHGAGVDGVKYFDTDLSGNPIV